jgi:hypothetical protein
MKNMFILRLSSCAALIIFLLKGSPLYASASFMAQLSGHHWELKGPFQPDRGLLFIPQAPRGGDSYKAPRWRFCQAFFEKESWWTAGHCFVGRDQQKSIYFMRPGGNSGVEWEEVRDFSFNYDNGEGLDYGSFQLRHIQGEGKILLHNGLWAWEKLNGVEWVFREIPLQEKATMVNPHGTMTNTYLDGLAPHTFSGLSGAAYVRDHQLIGLHLSAILPERLNDLYPQFIFQKKKWHKTTVMRWNCVEKNSYVEKHEECRRPVTGDLLSNWGKLSGRPELFGEASFTSAWHFPYLYKILLDEDYQFIRHEQVR